MVEKLNNMKFIEENDIDLDNIECEINNNIIKNRIIFKKIMMIWIRLYYVVPK